MVEGQLNSVKGKTESAKEGRRKLILHKLFAGEMGGPKYQDPAAKFEKAAAGQLQTVKVDVEKLEKVLGEDREMA